VILGICANNVNFMGICAICPKFYRFIYRRSASGKLRISDCAQMEK